MEPHICVVTLEQYLSRHNLLLDQLSIQWLSFQFAANKRTVKMIAHVQRVTIYVEQAYETVNEH